MIALPPGVRVYLACGTTARGKGMAGLAMLVQQGLGEDPFDGALYAFRGRRAGLIKLLWHDGVGLCLLTKKLEQGQFIWPSTTTTGGIALSASQLAALLDGCDWRAPRPRRRPESPGDHVRFIAAAAAASTMLRAWTSSSPPCRTILQCCSICCTRWSPQPSTACCKKRCSSAMPKSTS